MIYVKNHDFVITKDKLDGEALEQEEIEQLETEGYNIPFKLYDDDDILYYEGLLHEDCSDEFAPLDWAESDSGCTRLDTWNKNKLQFETI